MQNNNQEEIRKEKIIKRKGNKQVKSLRWFI